MSPSSAHDGDYLTCQTDARSPRSAVDTSPLSSVPSLPDAQTGDAEEFMPHRPSQDETESAQDFAQTKAIGDDADAALAEDAVPTPKSTPLFQCPYCDKTYATVKQLKIHTSDKRNVCYRERNPGWICPRCQMQFSSKQSATSHIARSCWKKCDECCPNNSQDCNAHDLAGACTICAAAGKSCSKHKGRVEGCVPQFLQQRPAAPSRDHRPGRKKRMAVASPENSPESKPKTKRGRPRRTAKPSEEDDSPDMWGIKDLFEPDSYTPGQSHLAFANETLSQLHPEPHGPEERQINPLPHGLSHGLASDGNLTGCVSATTGMPGMRRQPVLPALLPKDGKEIHSIAEGTRHAPTAVEQAQHREQVAQYDRTTRELFQRQRQRVHNMALMQQHMAVLDGGARPAPIISSARSSLRLEHNGFEAAPTGGIGNGGRRSGVLADFSIHEDPAHDPLSGSRYPVFGRSNPGSQVPSRQPSVVDGRLSMPGSRVPSRQPSIDRLDVALAGIGSCFTSRAPSPDHHRATLSHTSFDAQDHRQTNHSCNDRADKPAGSREVPPKLNQALSIPAFLPNNDATFNPTIRLRLNSNTYDPAGALLFSILTLRIHDAFGPRLEYYCAQRGMRFGLDAKFIYKYAAPTPSKPQRKKYFDLLYHTTPNMCFDREYPSARLGDGDTLLVCRRRQQGQQPQPDPQSAEKEDEMLGTQLSVPRIDIDIVNGERTIYQGEDVNVAWYRDADARLSMAKTHLAAMTDMAQRYAAAYTQSRGLARAIANESAQLRRQVVVLQGGYVPPLHGMPQGQFGRGHGLGLGQQHPQQRNMGVVLPQHLRPQRPRQSYSVPAQANDMQNSRGYLSVHPPVHVDDVPELEDGQGEEED